MTFSIMTLSTMALSITENKMWHSAKFHSALWQIIVMVSVVILNVIRLSVTFYLLLCWVSLCWVSLCWVVMALFNKLESISPIFYKQLFCTKVFYAAFMFGFVIFWRKDFGAKPSHKMLVKLKPSLCRLSLLQKNRDCKWTFSRDRIIDGTSGSRVAVHHLSTSSKLSIQLFWPKDLVSLKSSLPDRKKGFSS
jgi:hypothetical protein